ncbi:nickel ABC transporter, nickel/metallophore periplasmic binding protein [Oceanidesulfovibrio marinus]|uniref:Nickel ABC transporter, nickel/metallophore periplasmic binding protein n=2 Tax=Oceanidesulfovibrio marinus TaxID=370038 RepID=A0A6P1ZD76_9BACT|nr:nickel ABC transporter, nickel/metallophore periplasmic binding protein [Oceanidesulfovibrio marinus]
MLPQPLQAAPPEGDDVLVYSWNSNVGPLNPHTYSPSQMFAQAMVYEPLVRYQADGTIAPWLATSWKISEDGKEYTFTLRKDVTFSDGQPFNAEAVKKNFDTILLNHKNHDWLELVNQLHAVEEAGGQAVTVIDDHTVKLTLKAPYYPILQELALIRPDRFLSPAAFPESGDTAQGIKAPIGTGPWKVVEMVKGEYDVFERNEAYWGKKPAMKYLVVKVIPDSNARAVAFDTGEIDLIYGAGGHGGGQLGLDTFQRYQQMGNVEASVSPPLATRAMALNTKRFPTNDLAVRRAILHAVNKPAMVEHIFLGVEPQADTLFAPSMPYCDLGLAPYGFDPAEAEALLDKAGWTLAEGDEYRAKDGKELALELCFVGNDALQKSVAEVIQGDLKRIGIKVNLVGEESDSFYTRQMNGEFGIIFGDTWGPPYDPHSFCSSMRVPSHADYQAQLGLPMKAEIDEKIGQVLVTVDEKERADLYRDILTTLHEQAVYLPLTYMTSIMVHRPELKGASFGPTQQEIPFESMEKK